MFFAEEILICAAEENTYHVNELKEEILLLRVIIKSNFCVLSILFTDFF